MIKVNYKKPFFTLSFGYECGNAEFKDHLQEVRNLPVRKWNKKDKVWEVPQLSVKTLEPLSSLSWSPEAQEAAIKIQKLLLDLVNLKLSKGAQHPLLRPYQVVGAEFLVKAKKALLADDMGLGKTIQSIEAICRLNGKYNLILCPASVKWKWQDEFMKHFGLQACVVSGTKEDRRAIWESLPSPYIICNYDLLIKDWDIIPKEWSSIIADEAVYLKNPKAQRTKLARKLKSEARIALSGIYIETNLMEFQAIMEWIRPEIIPSAFQFKYRYCEIDEFTKKIIGTTDKLPELHLLTSPFILRREKTDKNIVSDLPEKMPPDDIPIEMTDSEIKMYSSLSKKFKEWIQESASGGFSSAAIWDGTVNCRQFTEFPDIVDPSWKDTPSKLTWLSELYDQTNKVVVFTFFRESANRLIQYFKTPFYITGEVDANDRFDISKKFNAASKAILISTDAGKFGLDLVGADTIVHYGFVHNPATMIQREDRLHRIGQKNPVFVYRPFLKNTIDEGIMKVFLRRQKAIKDFLSGSDTMSIVKLSVEDYHLMIEGQDMIGTSEAS